MAAHALAAPLDPETMTRGDILALARGKARKATKARTDGEKREVREDHRNLLNQALAALETEKGMAAWLVTRHIHGETITPANAALAAFQSPGELIGNYQQWKAHGCQVKKGESAELFLTGYTFWPMACWTGTTRGMTMPMLPDPCLEHAARLAALWISWPDHSTVGLSEWIEDVRPVLVEADSPAEHDDGPAIPF